MFAPRMDQLRAQLDTAQIPRQCHSRDLRTSWMTMARERNEWKRCWARTFSEDGPSKYLMCKNPPVQADTIRYTFLKKHNELRRDLAKGTLDAAKGTLRGSTSLFAMVQSEAIILATMDAKVVDEIEGQVFEDWSYTRFDGTLDQETVIYDDETIEPFANIIYNKSISLACVATYCDSTKKRAYACVYSSSPKRGEPLYLPGPNAKRCTKNACTKAIEGSTCITDTDSTDTFPAGLCRTKELVVPETDPVTESTIEPNPEKSSEATSTPNTNPNIMTQEIRDRIITLHNFRRTLLAKGEVRNGKQGNPNCGTATNMYRMKYNMSLEEEAQAYANTCALDISDVSTRPQSGENAYVIVSPDIQPLPAIIESIQAWWKQIYENGVNAKMLYNEYLETKYKAPIRFTQMAWASSYMVGCGLARCSGSTFVVCRYYPRGNIIGQNIYAVGPTCSACPNACSDSLCNTPR
ncbi:hypothetical protein RB195_007576 [Necator americanus]|uniref:SCP domain-containing protein n=2 Tax=Necator americanus TaxID=51031 RepID=A0ABR1C0L7_NECAM